MACFDENTLIEIAQGGATSDGLTSAEQHLAGCDRCARAFAAVAGVVAGGAASTAEVTARASSRESPRPLLAEGTVLKDRYRILRYIDGGGMGQVYEAAHTRLAGRYALKVLSLDLAGGNAMLQRFRREAELTSGLRHPNIVEAFDFDETPDGRPFLVMEFIEGRHLADVIHREGPLPLARVIELVTPVVSALSAIHRQQVVHRDLKPKNIMLSSRSEDGTEIVKVLDFGLSKRWGPTTAEALSVSVDRALLGTPLYMAPEQARGELHAVGPATDQFALAAIVYEMLTRQAPFAANTLHAILHKIVSVEPAPLRTIVSSPSPSLPLGVERAVMRALSKDPAQRFPSVREFLDALRDPVGSMPGVAAADNGRTMPRPMTHRRWFLSLLVLLSSASTLAAVAIFKPSRRWRNPVVSRPTTITLRDEEAHQPPVAAGVDAAAAASLPGTAGAGDAAAPGSGTTKEAVETRRRRPHGQRAPRAAAIGPPSEESGDRPLASPAFDGGSSAPPLEPERQPGVHLLP